MSFRRRYPEQRILTASGQLLVLRDIHPRDAQALIRGFARLSPEEIRMRFLYPMKALTEELAQRLTKLHRHRELALVLTTKAPPGEAPVFAVVRASRRAEELPASESNDVTPVEGHTPVPTSKPVSKRIADFAIVVPRALSGQGVGLRLMQALIARCQAAGYQQLCGEVLHENSAMLALGKKLGFYFSHHPHDGGILQMSLEL